MKTVIVGAGALGSLFAFFIGRAGKDVALLDNHAPRAEHITRNGLKVEGISGDHVVRVKASADAASLGPADLVMICVKAPDTAAAARGALPLLGQDTAVLTVQNGLNNVERIGEVVGIGRVLGGTTAHGATLLGDGHIRHAGQGETIIGEVDGSISDRVKRVREFLVSCGVAASITDNLESLIWSKLVINVGINALTAITRLKNGMLIEHDGTRAALAAAVDEAVSVVNKKSIRLLYDAPVAKVESVCRATAANISSMLQDVLHKHYTEVAYINGAIVAEARKLGIETPVNETLTRLVQTIEQSYEKALRP